MCSNSPSVNAVDETIDVGSWSAVEPLSATAVPTGTAWRYGVADSIRGFEPLDPGSNPGTFASSQPLGHGVMDSMLVCDTFDLGSNPSAPTSSMHGGAKTQPKEKRT